MPLVRALCRFGAAFAIACAAVAVSVVPPAAAETTTIGQLGGAPSSCEANLEAVQTSVTSGTSYAVPSGDWLVTSWSSQAGDGPAPSGSLQLELWRPTGTVDQYMLVGISPVEATSASGINTFSLSPPIAVQGGDRARCAP
jgi:hypothetical protein